MLHKRAQWPGASWRAILVFGALLVAIGGGPTFAGAQGTSVSAPSSDSLFRRARRMVSEGNGGAGRALVDTVLQRAEVGTPSYGDALFWRGALAQTAAEAERDYRRVIVEYPLSYYVDDALLAIAELEQARGDRAAALQHLQRFVKEHPASVARSTAALAAARLAFEQRDSRVGCSLISDARTSLSPADVELRNQVEYYAPRCAVGSGGGDPSTSPGTNARADSSKSAKPVAAAPAKQEPKAPAKRGSADPSSALAMKAPLDSSKLKKADPKKADPSSALGMTATADSSKSKRTAPKKADPSTALGMTANDTPGMAARSDSPPATHKRTDIYTIQLAAYNTRRDAEQLIAKLAKGGVHARVSGTAKPFRVRLDFYPTHQAAAAEVAALKKKGIVGFVTTEPPPVGDQSP